MIFNCTFDQFGYLRLHARISNKKSNIYQNINFCVDTGAPDTFISFKDAILIGIQFARFTKNQEKTPIGGFKYDTYDFKGSTLFLRSNTNKMFEIQFSPILILGPDPPGEKPLPSIIGMNYLSNFTLVINAKKYDRRAYLTDGRVQVV